MARILLAWEFGGNFGHLTQLLPLAKHLRAAGTRADLRAVRRNARRSGARPARFRLLSGAGVATARRASGGGAVQLLRNPPSLRLSRTRRPARHGEGLARDLRHVAPEVVVFDHAPTALLAARGLEAARVICGVGFCSPPRVQPLPNFRTWEEVPRARLGSSEAQVLDTVNAALAQLRLRTIAAVHELFDADEEFLCTFPELDHYSARPHGRYCGPVFARDEGDEAEWPDAGSKRVYVHLRPEMAAFDAVAEALSDSGESVLWVAPGLPDARIKRYAKRALRFVRRPVRLADIAAHADAAVLYGGHGTVAAMLLAGIPMALYPAHVEQALVTRNAVRIGAAAGAPSQADAAKLRRPLEAVLRDARLKEAARTRSRRSLTSTGRRDTVGRA